MSLFESGIRPILDDYLIAKSKEKRDYGKYWSASSAGYCQRKLIFERLGVESTLPDDPRKQRVFEAGHIFHEFLQRLTRNAGISIAQEVELQDEELLIRGHFDDLVLIDGKLILYDIKTVNSRSFMWAKKNGNAMSHFHRLQLGTYMYMLRSGGLPGDPAEIFRKMPNFDVKLLTEARILKIEKENLMMMEQQLLWSPELEKEVVGYWRTLNGYWKAKKIPKCTCADYEGGFMAKEKFNPFFYEGEPCSLEWYAKMKAEGKLKSPKGESE